MDFISVENFVLGASQRMRKVVPIERGKMCD
jgi:hypothetical protein